MVFKAMDQNGDPVEVKEALYENGDSLLGFKSLHVGMDRFKFTPDRIRQSNIRLTKPAIEIYGCYVDLQQTKRK